MNLRPKGTVTIPRTPKRGLSLLPWCVDVNRCLQQLRDRVITAPKGGRRGGGTKLPYDPKLFTVAGETPAYEVTLTHGRLGEILPGADDAVNYHEADNHWDEDDTTKLRRFPITVAQAVYLVAKILPTGSIGGEAPAVTIEVGADDQESVHYIPRVDTDDSGGAAGVIYYKIAVLEAAEEEGKPPKLKHFLSKSNLIHYQELPALLSTLAVSAGIGVIPKEYSISENAYKLRALSNGYGKNTITTNADHIEVRGTLCDSTVIVYRGGAVDLSEFLVFLDGYETTGTTVIGNEDPQVDPAEKKLYIPTVVHWDNVDKQINVQNLGVGGAYIYEVRGNSQNGSLTYTIGAGSAEPLISWKDGLITSDGEINIPIPEGIPEGYEEINVMICIDGYPTAYKILAKPIV
jgi:hypothetical protein